MRVTILPSIVRIIVVHYHFRPGGVRRVIEMGLPHLLRAAPEPVTEIILATGEAPDSGWLKLFQSLVAPAKVCVLADTALGYFVEQSLAPAALRERIQELLGTLFIAGKATTDVIWAHNPGIGRNLILTQELARLSARHNVRLAAHHHDWWFDNRWKRWPEMRACGFKDFDAVARAILPDAPTVRHFAINRFDAGPLEESFGNKAAWLPNLTDRPQPPAPSRLRKVRGWLREKLDHTDAPVWLLPCRLLRRKNVAEALLLTRWLRPEAWLATTGPVSSADEKDYAERLNAAARQQGWRLRLSILAGTETLKPSVPELLAVSECVMLTSIQEGFGLPFLEAAATGRPIIARALPNVAPDLAQFGFQFPQLYDELLVPTNLFDWPAEIARQKIIFRDWRRGLPLEGRRLAQPPDFLQFLRAAKAVAFSRLTLTAQLEILAHPLQSSWEACAALNPFLPVWKQRAHKGKLQSRVWPKGADRWLGGPAYARQFWKTMNAPPAPSPKKNVAGVAAQRELMRKKLGSEHLFALLWATHS